MAFEQQAIRTHCSMTTVGPLRDTAGEQDTFKPRGFWYSVDGDWEKWCKAEWRTRWEGYKYFYTVELGGENILRLTRSRDLDCFTDRFGDRGEIAWRAVARQYDGIEIAPYSWEKRLALRWYYTWDVASGCVWRPKGLALHASRKEER